MGDVMKKWYSLIDKVYRMDNLERAYKAVKANNGALGVDGVTVEVFGQNLQEELRQLHHELRTGIYEPQPVLRVEIPKVDGSKRPLGIPTVRDRVVQQALLNILQPIFEPDFHPSSYGYRPGRSCHQAVAKAEMFIVANCRGVFAELMGWIRRRLRMKKMKEWKTWKPLHKALRRRGYKGTFEKISMTTWKNSASPWISMALPNKWFDELGLINLEKYNVGILHHYRP